uniref:Uncharacterized protein n=1 Tax=Romanomermis culicivorax TaxID=13658 RepID=A0A915K9F6_ROMCU
MFPVCCCRRLKAAVDYYYPYGPYYPLPHSIVRCSAVPIVEPTVIVLLSHPRPPFGYSRFRHNVQLVKYKSKEY